MKVRVCGLLVAVFMFLGIFSLFSEDFWEGNAVVVRNGDIGESGLYALSDSFPKYSKIVVENLSNGKRVTVTVLDRMHGVTNIFLLLSREAAAKIGMKYGSIAHVRVSFSKEPGVVTGGMPGDLPYNPDPDINPAVEIPEEEVVIAEKPVKSEVVPPTTGKPPVKREASKREAPVSKSKTQVKEKPVKGKPVIKEKPVEKEKEPAVSKAEELVKELAKNRPEGLLFKRPTNSEEVVVIEKPLPKSSLSVGKGENLEIAALPRSRETKGEIPSLENLNVPSRINKLSGLESGVKLPGVEEPKTEVVAKEPSEKKEMKLEIEKKPVEPEKKEKVTPLKREIAKPSAERPFPKKGEVVLKLEPTGPKPPPPVATGVKEKAKIAVSSSKVSSSKKPVIGEITKKLPKGTYFLQVAAYYSEGLANRLVSRLSSSYPVTVLSVRKNDKTLYKVLVGPLNGDESGALLYWFRSKGYRDSFIRTP